MAASHVTLKDLLDCKLVSAGEIVGFKGETGVITDDGNISYQGSEFSSLSRWAKEVASKKGLSKHYNGWKVVHTRNRPLCQFREQFYALARGQPYTFPQPVLKKRRRRSVSAQPRKRQRAPSPKEKSKEQYGVCSDSSCILCKQGPPSYFKDSLPTWADILRVVLYLLAVKHHPNQQFFSLSSEIYPFISAHFDILECDKQSMNWKQTVKMTLSHARYAHLFESGYETLAKTGHWRLKPGLNPYGTSPHQRSPSPSSPSERDNETSADKVLIEDDDNSNQGFSRSSDQEYEDDFIVDDSGSDSPRPLTSKRRFLRGRRFIRDSKVDDEVSMESSPHVSPVNSQSECGTMETEKGSPTPGSSELKPSFDTLFSWDFVSELLKEEGISEYVVPNVTAPAVSSVPSPCEEIKNLRKQLLNEKASHQLTIEQLQAAKQKSDEESRAAQAQILSLQDQNKRNCNEISRLQAVVTKLSMEMDAMRSVKNSPPCDSLFPWFSSNNNRISKIQTPNINSATATPSIIKPFPELWEHSTWSSPSCSSSQICGATSENNIRHLIDL